MKAKHEVAHVLAQHRDQLPVLVPNSWKRRTLYALMRCRTAEMGGHIDKCNNPSCQRFTPQLQ